jgi:aminoglycoside 3-N-acetyltransferase
MPGSALGLARRLRRQRSRAANRTRQRIRPVHLTGDDVAEALSAGGLGPGDTVFFQASMARFGHIQGGGEAVIEALEGVLARDGVVAMPSFPFKTGMAEYLSSDPVFDIRRTPSAMGTISERFRVLPGTRRSLHPTHPVCARGPGAAELVVGHESASTPFGEGTPFVNLVRRGAHQVWFGTDVHAFTIYHAFECMLGARFPIKVFLDEPVRARCIDAEGRERVVETLVHDPTVARRRIRSDSRQVVRQRLLDSGVMRSVRLGAGEILVASMPEMFELLEGLLRDGLTIYDIDVESAPRA